MGCIELASQVAKRFGFAKLGDFYMLSPLHRRALFCDLGSGETLGVKGVGWTLGPPWSWQSQKDAQLWMGLLDEASAKRELLVCNSLLAANVNCAKVLGYTSLNSQDMSAIDTILSPAFADGTFINPAALFTKYRSQFRVSDCFGRLHDAWVGDFVRNYPKASLKESFNDFTLGLAMAIVTYQSLGGVNDTLGPENVTLAGEITDFEWIYFPGIDLLNGESSENIINRQRKEWIYFLETLFTLSFNLSLPFCVNEVIDIIQPTLVGTSGFVLEAFSMRERVEHYY